MFELDRRKRKLNEKKYNIVMAKITSEPLIFQYSRHGSLKETSSITLKQGFT